MIYTTEQRADLARWAISLRRASAARTLQTTGQLTRLNHSEERRTVAHCCLGIWCQIKLAAGELVSQASSSAPATVEYASPMIGSMRQGGNLPWEVELVGQLDPILLTVLVRDAEDMSEGELEDLGLFEGESGAELASVVAGNAEDFTAAQLNDDIELTFDQIADVIAWSFQLTDAELAAAERAPRVPEVEGPAPEPAP